MSPELIHSNCYTTFSDIFSFGISMWECFTYGEIPWKNLTDNQVSQSQWKSSEKKKKFLLQDY